MGKQKAITRAKEQLENAYEIALERSGQWTPRMDSQPPPPGLYRVIPAEDAKDMIGVLDAEDARESKLERSRKRRKAKKAPAKRAKKKASKRKPTAKQRKIRYKGL